MDIPNEFICPITQDLMVEPVCDNEGNTYDKKAIMKWLARNRTSPISRKPLRIADLRPNIALKNLIISFNEKNKESIQNLTMREARLKRFDGPDSSNNSERSDMGPPPGIPAPGMPPPGMPPPGMDSVREPDPITQDTLIPNEMSDEELHYFMFGDVVFTTPSYTIPESVTTFGGNVIQITDSTYDGHKYLCKNYCCVNIPMPRTGYCKKCRDMSRRGVDISKSWNPTQPSFKIHKGYLKNYLNSKYLEQVGETNNEQDNMVFELETKDKFKCVRHVIKDIRTHNLKGITISDYPVSIDDEDIIPYLHRFFN